MGDRPSILPRGLTKHPGRTPAERRILDQIGSGESSPMMHEKTRRNMLDAGLIEKCGEQSFGDAWGKVTIDEFQMPIPVHVQWCKFQSENCDEPF